MSDVCPHTCVQCGEPCYIGFGLAPKCTNKACHNYDEQTWVDWVMSLPDPGDPPTPLRAMLDDWDEDTDPMGFTLTKFRDFCSSCHIPVDFSRVLDPFTGTHYAFCPQCGDANIWTTP